MEVQIQNLFNKISILGIVRNMKQSKNVNKQPSPRQALNQVLHRGNLVSGSSEVEAGSIKHSVISAAINSHKQGFPQAKIVGFKGIISQQSQESREASVVTEQRGGVAVEGAANLNVASLQISDESTDPRSLSANRMIELTVSTGIQQASFSRARNGNAGRETSTQDHPTTSHFAPNIQHSSQPSQGFGNKVTRAGATLGDPEDSSLLNSQTQNMRELDIDVEVGGLLSNLISYSSNIQFPKIQDKIVGSKNNSNHPVKPAQTLDPVQELEAFKMKEKSRDSHLAEWRKHPNPLPLIAFKGMLGSRRGQLPDTRISTTQISMGTASLRASLEQRLANKVANKAVAENVTRSVQQSPSNLAGNQWKDNSFLVPAPDWRRNTTRMITQPNQKENKSVTFDTTSQQLSYQIKPEDNVLMQAPPPDDTQLSAKRSTRYERGLGKAQTLFMNTQSWHVNHSKVQRHQQALRQSLEAEGGRGIFGPSRALDQDKLRSSNYTTQSRAVINNWSSVSSSADGVPSYQLNRPINILSVAEQAGSAGPVTAERFWTLSPNNEEQGIFFNQTSKLTSLNNVFLGDEEMVGQIQKIAMKRQHDAKRRQQRARNQSYQASNINEKSRLSVAGQGQSEMAGSPNGRRQTESQLSQSSQPTVNFQPSPYIPKPFSAYEEDVARIIREERQKVERLRLRGPIPENPKTLIFDNISSWKKTAKERLESLSSKTRRKIDPRMKQIVRDGKQPLKYPTAALIMLDTGSLQQKASPQSTKVSKRASSGMVSDASSSLAGNVKPVQRIHRGPTKRQASSKETQGVTRKGSSTEVAGSKAGKPEESIDPREDTLATINEREAESCSHTLSSIDENPSPGKQHIQVKLIAPQASKRNPRVEAGRAGNQGKGSQGPRAGRAVGARGGNLQGSERQELLVIEGIEEIDIQSHELERAQAGQRKPVQAVKRSYVNEKFQPQIEGYRSSQIESAWMRQQLRTKYGQFNIPQNLEESDEGSAAKELNSQQERSPQVVAEPVKDHVDNKDQGVFDDQIAQMDLDNQQLSFKMSAQIKHVLIQQYLNENRENLSKTDLVQMVNLTELLTSELDILDVNQDYRQIRGTTADQKVVRSRATNDYIGFLTQGVINNELVFEFARSIKQNLAIDLISNSNLKSINMIDALANEVLSRIKLKDFYLAGSGGPRKQYTFDSFVRHCVAQNRSILPVFQKIFNKSLILVDYKIEIHICQAIKESFKSNPQLIQALLLDNCGLKDQHTMEILEGVAHLDQIKALSIKRSELGMRSLGALQSIISKRFPSQLSELSIVNCKLSREFQMRLFEIMSVNHCEIEVLTLVEIGLTPQTLPYLINHLMCEQDCFLRELDLSVNPLPSSTHYMPLLIALGTCNKPFESISLAGNAFLDTQAARQVVGEVGAAKIKEQELQLTEYLSQILVNKRSLTHLNLSNTGLSEQVLQEILPLIKSSPSLVGVHLSTNPGLTEQSMARFAQLLEVRYEAGSGEDRAMPLSFEMSKDAAGRRSLSPDLAEQAQPDDAPDTIRTANKQSIQIRRILKEKQHLTHVYKGSFIKSQNIVFHLHRILGLDSQLAAEQGPASKWRLNTSDDQRCWVCNRNIYTILFWNKQIAKLKHLRIDNGQEVVQEIRKRNKELAPKKPNAILNALARAMSNPTVGSSQRPTGPPRPVLFSESNGWKGIPLLTLSEFCFLIDQKKTVQLNELDYKHIKDLEFADPKQFEHLDIDALDQLLFYKSDVHRSRRCIHNNLQYRDPQFINTDFLAMHTLHEPGLTTYLLPQFLEAGKYEYVIKYVDEYTFHNCVVHFRTESLPVNVVNSEISKNKPVFVKPASVFADWRQDTDSKVTKCIDHDLKNLNLSSLYQDKETATTIGKYITQNFRRFKHAFVCCLAQSEDVSGIDWQSMNIFIFKVCGFGSILNIKQTDQLFKDVIENFSTFGKGTRQAVDPSRLCRKEFIELLLRVGQIEYPLSSAIEQIRKVMNLVMSRIDPLESWQGFRDEELWTAGCSNLLLANLSSLETLVMKYNGSNDKAKLVLPWRQVEHIFLKDCGPPICSRQILVRAVVLSKQTITNDFDSAKQAQKMLQLEFCELMEVFGRVSAMILAGTTQQTKLLHKKMEQVLAQAIRLADCKFRRHEDAPLTGSVLETRLQALSGALAHKGDGFGLFKANTLRIQNPEGLSTSEPPSRIDEEVEVQE